MVGRIPNSGIVLRPKMLKPDFSIRSTSGSFTAAGGIILSSFDPKCLAVPATSAASLINIGTPPKGAAMSTCKGVLCAPARRLLAQNVEPGFDRLRARDGCIDHLQRERLAGPTGAAASAVASISAKSAAALAKAVPGISVTRARQPIAFKNARRPCPDTSYEKTVMAACSL